MLLKFSKKYTIVQFLKNLCLFIVVRDEVHFSQKNNWKNSLEYNIEKNGTHVFTISHHSVRDF